MASKGETKINNICAAIRRLTPTDFEQVEHLANSQMNYVHPLKYATAAKFNRIGKNNMKILESLKILQSLIKTHRSKP